MLQVMEMAAVPVRQADSSVLAPFGHFSYLIGAGGLGPEL
jgi:hypothetical protein